MSDTEFPVLDRSEHPGAVSLRVRIPEGHACFTGHFPGAPILPGIAHLALVDQTIRAFLGEGLLISALPSLRLRRDVRPEEILDVLVRTPAGDGTVRFELRRDGHVVSAGTLVLARPRVAP